MKDLIERQAAVDALCSVCGYDCDKSEFVYDAPQDEQVILCPEHYALTQLPSVQPEQRWIPCSERLPEKNRKPNTFLVTDSDGKLSISKFYFPLSNSDIDKPYWSGMIDVVAWMPLPEPYKDAQ